MVRVIAVVLLEPVTDLEPGQRGVELLVRPIERVLRPNLDADGDKALTQAIVRVRQRGGIVIVVAHRPSALAGVDQVLAMLGGRPHALGPRDEVLAKLFGPAQPAQPPAAPAAAAAGGGGLRLVGEAGGTTS